MRFNRVLEGSLNEIYIFDAETLHFVEVNLGARENLGYSIEELRALTPLDLKPEFTAESFAKLVEPLRAGVEEKTQFTTIHRRKDGTQYPVEVHLQLMTDGTPLFVAIILDITERRRVEQERERMLHDTGERVKELRCMYGVAESICRRETLERVFEDVVALIPPGWQCPEITRGRIRFDDREYVSQPFEETEWRQSADIVIAGEPRGTIEVFHLDECPELDEGPFLKEKRDLIDGIARALSEAVEHNHVDMERERLMHAIEQAKESIVITDVDGTIQYINPTFAQITGYARDEVIGQNPRILKSGEHDDTFFKEMWARLTRGEAWNGRLVNKKKDGTLFTEEVTISPVHDDAGKTVNYVAVKRDITENIRLEEQYHQAQKVESIGRLAGGVAHDLNNLLTPILGYGEMLLDDLGSDDTRRESVDEILRAGFRARDLVRQLLAFSRKQTPELLT